MHGLHARISLHVSTPANAYCAKLRNKDLDCALSNEDPSRRLVRTESLELIFKKFPDQGFE